MACPVGAQSRMLVAGVCRIRRPAFQIPGLVVLSMLRFYGFRDSQSVSRVLNLLSVGGLSEVGHFLTWARLLARTRLDPTSPATIRPSSMSD